MTKGSVLNEFKRNGCMAGEGFPFGVLIGKDHLTISQTKESLISLEKDGYVDSNDNGFFWKLTEKGEKLLYNK